MSHQDLVRYPASRGPNGAPNTQQAADDLWMQQQALAVAGAPQPSLLAHGNGGGGNEIQPIQMVHRSLRGRYKLAILLAAIGAVVGTAVGWTQNEKVFRAKGVVRVDAVRTTASGSEPQPEFVRYMGSEATWMKSPDFLRRVMQRPEWKNVATGSWDEGAFSQRLTTAYGNALFDINVSFDHPNRDIAQAAVTATLKAYEDVRAEQRASVSNDGVDYWQREVDRLTKSIKEANAKINEIQLKDADGNLEKGLDVASTRLAQLQGELDDANYALRRMKNMRDAAKANPLHFTPEQLANREPTIARLLTELMNVQAEYTRIARQYGTNAPAVRALRDQLDSLDSRVQQLADTIGKSIYGILPSRDPQQPTVYVDDDRIAASEAEVKDLETFVKEAAERVANKSGVRYSLATLENEISSNQDLLKDRAAKLANAQASAMTLNANVRTFTDPNVAVAEDKRPSMATFGFVAGGALPLIGLTLYGLFDRKYRYSDETTASGSTRGVPLLGILPNLPDRLSDPSQASVAAHCVHQIRTMLQLNVLAEEGPAVLSVTSATSGDGKTSLSLALGLSFAASGSRTLLVDTDLIGAGLSARLGIREPQGIGEAIATRDPMSYVRETDVAGLSVLPVGTEGGQNASSFSPSAVRRLIAQVREHFDIVLIDTGPVLGSIEATPVVAASDAVILTVARGQNRDLVEKAIGHLRAIGARIAGVVFNRANARDFERSISGISLRSVSRASSLNGNGSTNGHTSSTPRQDKRLGPLVHSVRGTREETN